jgi:short-subunit dehydrogenase
MKTLKDKVAVITGAGSGIGKAIAFQLAECGCHLALNDIRKDELLETAEEIRKSGQIVSTHLEDVSDNRRVLQLSSDIIQKHGQVDLLVNNAGLTMARCSMQETSMESWKSTFKVNFWGTLHCIRAFYPYLQESREAHIVNVSSISALVSASNRGPYCASKFAVRGLTETLIQETMGSKIRVTSVIPGLVATKLALHAHGWKCKAAQLDSYLLQQKTAPTTAKTAARKIVKGIRKNKKRVLIGPDAIVLDVLYRLFPMLTLKLMHKVATLGERRMLKRMETINKKENTTDTAMDYFHAA